jgi:hypothetical protein
MAATSSSQPCEATVYRVLGCCMQKEGAPNTRMQHSNCSWRRAPCSRPPCSSWRCEHLRFGHPTQ